MTIGGAAAVMGWVILGFVSGAWGQTEVKPAGTAPVGGAGVDAEIVVHLDQKVKGISPDLFGVFFEDLNYAADGGLYAEMVSNRSFEYSAVDSPEWNALTGWTLVKRGNAGGRMAVQDAAPLNANNPQYLVLMATPGRGGAVGIANEGFDGMAVKAGETYNFSVFARCRPRERAALTVHLESMEGAVYASAVIPGVTTEWAKYSAALKCDRDDAHARLVVLTSDRATLALDMVSLFPAKTFHDRPNGLRADLAQAIADLHPHFVRFPGGCLTHGDGVKNIYRWKDSIGPVEARKGQKNIWRYHQSLGLGYFEYFQFCEDIGATPLPIVAAGVSCQNSDFASGTGQQCVPMLEMGAYVQDVLDLMEWANGPADSTWGAKRAAAGHPAPFHLRYLGLGNEDAITPGFKERFKMIFDAVRAKYPEITVVGTVGPSPAGRDFEEGWKLAEGLHVPVVDEHYYQQPKWFLENQVRYDKYARGGTKVYVGEYASWGDRMENALAEAGYMTALERNGDVVQMASYAPLLCNVHHVQWYPDLIYFDNERVYPTVNYYVQQLFSSNAGDGYVASTLKLAKAPGAGENVSFSAVRDSKSGDLILKLVNLSRRGLRAKFRLAGGGIGEGVARGFVLAGEEGASNPGDPRGKRDAAGGVMAPKGVEVKVGGAFEYEAPGDSLTVLRVRGG
ncbi:MAG: alpha-L-arabinofuranosidase C-terminal domain-containing protein [Phycisphaerae bacterium]